MQTPLSINHRPGNPVRGKAKGLRLNSPAWLCRRRRDRRGGTTHGPGPAGGTPLSVRTPCRGRPRHDELPENESGACASRGCLRSRSRCQVRGKRRFLRTSGAGKRSGLPAGSRKREPGAAAGPTDSAQAASSALLMGESSAKPTPRKGIKRVRSYRIFIKSGVVYRAV